jgi:hypothetical protein
VRRGGFSPFSGSDCGSGGTTGIGGTGDRTLGGTFIDSGVSS